MTSLTFGLNKNQDTWLTRGVIVGLLCLVIGAMCLVLVPYFSWLVVWPDAWAFPVNDWISKGLGWFFHVLKPAARWASWLLEFPMQWANSLFVAMPWPFTLGLVTAIGWYLGGFSMALLGFSCLGFVLSSGYWNQSMATLSLVAVSVPLALLMGSMVGILAHKVPRVKHILQVMLDVMQTVPTFAYLTPLLFLFGFGPVVGLIASAIYAAPPMARNVILGLEKVDEDIREAAIMSGANGWQQLFLVEVPAAMKQIMVGVNQSLMAALSMVIIAAVIGGFNDIGWEVLLTMRKAQFGQSLLAGLVIVAFAITIDRMSGALAHELRAFDPRIALIIFALGVLATLLSWNSLPDPSTYTWLDGVAASVDASLGTFTAAYGTELDSIKNGAMFYGLLPLRIGLDDSVLPFTWGFQWTPVMSAVLFGVALIMGGVFAWRGRPAMGLFFIIFVGIVETGITQLPWPFVLAFVGGLSYMAGGRRLTIIALALLVIILLSGLWSKALLSAYLSLAAVLMCVLLGGTIGLACAVYPLLWRIVQPVCDMLQTIPLFVFLIPVLMFFQIGEFSAFLAICAYAIVPMIRYTRYGLVTTPDELIEAAIASGATPWQTMCEVRLPYAAPTILLGLNQTILFAFAMLVIAALIGTTGLGQSIFLALGQADIGLGIAAGAAMAMLAFIADRLVQGFAAKRRRALGL